MFQKSSEKFVGKYQFILLILLLTGTLLFVSACGEEAEDRIYVSSSTTATTNSVASAEVVPGEDLIIPISEVSETATFYPVTVDGIDMEIIAVMDSTGAIRTAFNTCQICYDSGRGYYEQVGNTLVCQNCGNRFTVDQVEVETGGCNPWPIFETNKTVTEDSIVIPYTYLLESSKIFQNWKISY